MKKNKVVVASKPAPAYGGNNSNNNAKKNHHNNKGHQVRTKESTKRQAMLNTHRINPFKYDVNEVLSNSSMDPSKASSFLASVIAKASRVSSKDAKEFIKTFLESGDLTKEEHDRICRLLDKYSKYR